MVLHLTQSREDTHTAESDQYTAGDPYNNSLSRWLRNQAQTDVRIQPTLIFMPMLLLLPLLATTVEPL